VQCCQPGRRTLFKCDQLCQIKSSHAHALRDTIVKEESMSMIAVKTPPKNSFRSQTDENNEETYTSHLSCAGVLGTAEGS